MDRNFLAAAAVLGALAVLLGAFAAHALRARLGADMLAVFQTGVLYHWLHTLALIGVAWAAQRFPSAYTTAAGCCFIAGIVLFSGSLYAMVLTGMRGLGAITPIGGVVFISGWVCLGWAALRGGS